MDIDPKKTNKGTPEETGSYLLSKDLPEQCLYTRMSALQKLKVKAPNIDASQNKVLNLCQDGRSLGIGTVEIGKTSTFHHSSVVLMHS